MMLRMESVCFGLIMLVLLAGGRAGAAEPFYEGKTVKDSGFRSLFDAAVVGMRRGGNLGSFTLEESAAWLAAARLADGSEAGQTPGEYDLARDAQHTSGLYALVDLHLWGDLGLNGHWPVETIDGSDPPRQDLCP